MPLDPKFKLRALPGTGFGLRQKIMIGTITMDNALSPRLDQIIKSAIETFPDPFYHPEWEATLDEVSALKFIHLYFLLQQSVKIPVFEEFKLRAISPNSGSKVSTGIHTYEVALPYWNIHASKTVISWIYDTMRLPESAPDVGGLHRRISSHGLLGLNAYPFVRAGWQKKIHTSQLIGRVIQFGIGAQSRWIHSSITDRTSAIGVKLCKNKNLTNHLLTQLGFPVPKQIVATNLQRAKEASSKLGMPVVIKPLDQDQGRGVCVGLYDDDEVEQAFKTAAAYGPAVIVEECCQGRDYRLIVFQGMLVKVMQRTPLSVAGDGRSSIAELLERKRKVFQKPWISGLKKDDRFAVDNEILRTIRRQGYELDFVPQKNQTVPLRSNANLSTGGSQALIPLDSVHPDNARLAISLTSILRLDCCGIDLLTTDIRQSWLQVGCHIIELNSQPQIGVKYDPDVYGQILQQLLSKPAPSLLLILDAFGSEPSSNLTPDHPIMQQLCVEDASVVIASSTHLWRDSQLIQVSPQTPGATIQAALRDPAARSLVLIMSVADCLAQGLPTHKIDKIFCVTSIPGGAKQVKQLNALRALAAGVPLTLLTP